MVEFITEGIDTIYRLFPGVAKLNQIGIIFYGLTREGIQAHRFPEDGR